MPSADAGDQGPETPEALMISALLTSGSFDPQRHHLTEDDLECWRKLWQFGVLHHQQSGCSPSLDLVALKFPDFTFTPNVERGYAAYQLHRASNSRKLRRTIRKALTQLGEDNLEGAYDELATITRPRSSRKPAHDAFDHSLIDMDFKVSRIPVHYRTLTRVTGGIGPGELWFWAARPGEGKTYNLCAMAATAAMAGENVRYVSLEMPARVINHRVRRMMANKDELTKLDSSDPMEIKKGIDQLRERVSGDVSVVDPSHGRMTSAVIREQMDEGTLVMVDHAGLMSTSDGRRAVDDWRAMAMISNSFKEDILATGVPLVAAAQLNRTADTAGNTPPKLSQLSQSDALGQDADVVVTQKKLSERVRAYSAEKNREGEPARWWGLFDIKKASLKELSWDEAVEIQAVDEDKLSG